MKLSTLLVFQCMFLLPFGVTVGGCQVFLEPWQQQKQKGVALEAEPNASRMGYHLVIPIVGGVGLFSLVAVWVGVSKKSKKPETEQQDAAQQDMKKVVDSHHDAGASHPMPTIEEFYSEKKPDQYGRTLTYILSQNDRWLEDEHNFIQWLFPLREKGSYPATLFDKEQEAVFQASIDLQNNMRRSLVRMLAFYGFSWNGDKSQIVKSMNYEECAQNWLTHPHNFLRISRILRSLRLAGLLKESAAFYGALETLLSKKEKDVIGGSWAHWQKAAQDDIQPL